MSFNLLEYLKNNPLLKEEKELPKGKWVDLDSQSREEYKQQIFDLINQAYAYIGGHSNYKSADDVTGAEGDADYEVINLDNDPEIDAVSVSKKGPGGTKFTATGHDGSSDAKSKVINHKADLLKQSGFYIEASGKIKDVLIAKGAPIVKNPEIIKKALAGKEIEKFNEDGSYIRKIAGHPHEKIMLGNPI